jgi:hypothetical protein
MDSQALPAAVRERLGPEATAGLLDVLETARREWRDDVIEVCATRFERRLTEEVSKLRLEIVQGDSGLRQEMSELGGNLRREMMELGAGLRQEMSDGRFELLKWCFVFWVGQVVAVGAIVGVMFRFARP